MTSSERRYMPKKINPKEPLISVVMPTYNNDWCISDAIRSIMGQTYSNWELIIVDDGSTDTTKDVLKFWEGLDKRIKPIYRTENKGIAYSRNEGNAKASGHLIVIMDSDDLMLSERLMAAEKTYKKTKYDVLYTAYYRKQHGMGIEEIIEVPEQFTDDLLEPTQKIPHLTMIATKETFNKVPYRSDKRINDDWFWCVDLYNSGAKFVGLNFPTMIHQVNPQGVSLKNQKQYKKDYKDCQINKELRKQNEKNT
jgi:teichuronic acid biosynthesis glycosyltransferase TuaG